MSKNIISFLVLVVFCISCGNNSGNQTKVEKPIPTITKESIDFGPVGPDQDRVDYAQSIIKRADSLIAELDVPELNIFSEYLNRCSIWKPEGEGGANISPISDEACRLVVWKEGDKSPYLQDMMSEDLKSAHFAFYDHLNEMIVIRMLPNNPENKLSLDFLAIVLVHEAVHALFDDKECFTLECRASNEAYAYQVEFLLLDILGNKKNPGYGPTLQKAAETMAPAYEATGKVVFPNYEKDSKNMKMYFESDSDLQDQLWLSVFWLRSYWQMYIYLREDMPSADISFQAFLKEMYGSGSMK